LNELLDLLLHVTQYGRSVDLRQEGDQ
jgi:hypothetical protein